MGERVEVRGRQRNENQRRERKEQGRKREDVVWCGCITESQEEENECSTGLCKLCSFLQQSYNEHYEVLVTQ